MQQVSRMHVLEALEHLVDNVLLVDVLEDVRTDDGVQIRVHKVKHQVDVAVVFRAHHVLEPDNILVARKLLQENDLAEGALGVRGILERIEVLFQRHDLLGALINCLPYDTVRSLSYRLGQISNSVKTYPVSRGSRTF